LTGGRKLVSLLEKKRVGCGCMSALLGFLHFSKIVSRTPALKVDRLVFEWIFRAERKRRKPPFITFVGTFIGAEWLKDILDQNWKKGKKEKNRIQKGSSPNSKANILVIEDHFFMFFCCKMCVLSKKKMFPSLGQARWTKTKRDAWLCELRTLSLSLKTRWANNKKASINNKPRWC
jgi:hypothetical protein